MDNELQEVNELMAKFQQICLKKPDLLDMFLVNRNKYTIKLLNYYINKYKDLIE